MGRLFMIFTMWLRWMLAVCSTFAGVFFGMLFLLCLLTTVWMLPRDEAEQLKEKMYD